MTGWLSMNEQVLVIENDPIERALICAAFERAGLRTAEASGFEEAFRWLAKVTFELVVVSTDTPQIDGASLYIEILRRRIQLACLFIVSSPSEVAPIFGVAVEDYVLRQTLKIELIVRARSLLKRNNKQKHVKTELPPISAGPLTIDHEKREAILFDRKLDLTALEFDLLLYFATFPGIVLSRERLLAAVWGSTHHGYEKTVVMHICRLRRKLKVRRDIPSLIETVRGYGYRFDEHPGGLGIVVNQDVAVLPKTGENS